MNLARYGHVILLLAVALTLLEAEGRKCRKGDKSKCKRKRDKSSKKRATRSDKNPAPPSWKKRPPRDENQAVREGSDLTLTCATKGHPAPALSWLRHGQSLGTGRNSRKKYRQRRNRLTIRSLQVLDSGQYTCIAKNELGVLNFTYTIKVLENMPLNDVEVVQVPQDQTAHPGDTVIFHCRSKDWPKPKVYWIRKTDSRNIMESVSAVSDRSGELVLHNVTKTDSGIYTCSIGNDIVNRELSARLTVIDQDERLPFEPPCSLHIRSEQVVDLKTGCRSDGPVEIYYCMGSCGRSYYVPKVVMTEATEPQFLNQTCGCCVGEVDAIHFLEMSCPLGVKKQGLFEKLRGCSCQPCQRGPVVGAEDTSSFTEEEEDEKEN